MPTFALKTAFATGDNGATIEVIELDCAAVRFRRICTATTRRSGEMTASNAPGAIETYPTGSVMAQIAGPLCGCVGGGEGTPIFWIYAPVPAIKGDIAAGSGEWHAFSFARQ